MLWARDATLVFTHLHACDAAPPEPFAADGRGPAPAPGAPPPFRHPPKSLACGQVWGG